MAVPEVLIHVPLIGLGHVEAACRRGVGGDQRCAMFQMERDVAFQPDRVRQILTRGEHDGPAAGSRRSFNRLIDRIGVERFAIALRAMVSDIVHAGGVGRGLGERGHCETSAGESKEFSAGGVFGSHSVGKPITICLR